MNNLKSYKINSYKNRKYFQSFLQKYVMIFKNIMNVNLRLLFGYLKEFLKYYFFNIGLEMIIN